MNQRKGGARNVFRHFHVVWIQSPSDALMIEAGARALRLHAQRLAARRSEEVPGTESPP